MAPSVSKILVAGPSWVGDMVMSQPLYELLHHDQPDVIIDVLAPPFSGALVARMPRVRRHIALPVAHGEVGLKKRWQLGRSLAGEGYTQAIVLPNSWKSALVPFFAGIARRTGWRGEMRYGVLNDLRKLDASALPQMVQRYVALGRDRNSMLWQSITPPRLLAERSDALACAQAHGLLAGDKLLALCPGAEFGAAKQWPVAHFAEVAGEYLAEGWSVVLLGSSNDETVCTGIFAATGEHQHCHNLAGKTTLAEVVDLLSLCSAVVSNDSGLMHIAGALDVPLVAIYGATSPTFTPPSGTRSAVISSNIDCAPCFERQCPLQHHRCMQEISPQMVLQRLGQVNVVQDATP